MKTTKFQAKYNLRVDRDETKRRADARSLYAKWGGGRHEKSEEPANAQLTIKTEDEQANALFGPNKVQVSWSPDQDICALEKFLNELVTFMPDEHARFGPDTRIAVPTTQMYTEQLEKTAIRARHSEWKNEVNETIRRAAMIRDGKVGLIPGNRLRYVAAAQKAADKLETLINEAVEKGWECNDSIKKEQARLREIVRSKVRS